MKRAVFILACLSLGCGHRAPTGWQVAFTRGNRDRTAGRMLDAAGAFDLAARETHSLRDQREALFLAAQSLYRAGLLAPALERMDALARDPDSARSARAALESARIRIEIGARAEAVLGLDALVRARPETGPARRALSLLLSELDRDDPSGASAHARLSELSRALPRDTILDSVLYEDARRYDSEARRSEAIALWRRLLDEVPYPQNRHWDDGALRLAQDLGAAANPREAVAVLDRALSVRERAYSNGSYEAPRFAECAMLRARLLRDPLGELEASARAFHFVYSSFATSRLRDDALWEEAAVRSQMGHQGAACDALRLLMAEFPLGSRAREARADARACERSTQAPLSR